MNGSITDRELEYRICYAIIVAGKSAKFATSAVERLFPVDRNETPFEVIRDFVHCGHLRSHLEECRTGNYTKIERAFCALAIRSPNLRTCTAQDLEIIHGIGPKTSRFFILWTRPDARYAALDVHVLRWLKGLGYDAPRSTPSGKKYAELEMAFLSEADKRGILPSALDAQIWEAASASRNMEAK